MIKFLKYISVVVLIITNQFCFAQPSQQLDVKIITKDGSYKIYNKDQLVLHAQIAAKINGKWIHANDYPKHSIKINNSKNSQQTVVTHTGLAHQPDLIFTLRTQPVLNSREIDVQVKNNLNETVTVQAIRLLESTHFNLGNNLRVLSDSYSEDRPTIRIYDFKNAPSNIHRAVGSQLFYNRDTQNSLFFAALTSKRFLTIMRLNVADNRYEIDSTGTTEINKDYCLQNAPKQDQIELSLPVAPGESLTSERILFNISSDYHAQLESYGKLIRTLYHARVSAPTLMGWWSWTAYYMDLNQEQAGKDAVWLAQYLKHFGYNLFHLDEGYQAARGDYTLPHIKHFPDGLQIFSDKIHDLDLNLGLWSAPFEVSDHSELYKNHPDWLVKNADGNPIALVREDGNDTETLFVLDSTHPGAQQYLRETYSILAKKWGARYFKFDFMEDTAIEGMHYQPNTTALEAQRIGLKIIREVVGDSVLLDKDGSPMLNLVGIVDLGRISVDTAHQFAITKDSAIGIAARYYMHRNFFVTDPDAFTVSRFRKDNIEPLTTDEAKVSIALAAISGGMFEIGDNLQLLKSQPERLELLENQELLNIIRAGRVSIPLDLMTYDAQDEQPSIFLLRQNSHQAVLTVFNWTEKTRKHKFDLADFGFSSKARITDILDKEEILTHNNGKLILEQPRHSVRMLKIVM